MTYHGQRLGSYLLDVTTAEREVEVAAGGGEVCAVGEAVLQLVVHDSDPQTLGVTSYGQVVQSALHYRQSEQEQHHPERTNSVRNRIHRY